VSYGNVTAGPKVVQIYNSITNSLDTIFLWSVKSSNINN
jgi:hypothetical protein